MRSSDEQLREIMRRGDRIIEKQNMKKTILKDALVSGVCLALLIAFAVFVPDLAPVQTGGDAVQYGSLLLAAPYLGYVIVSLLAFTLGVSLTLLCIHWKKQKERERK